MSESTERGADTSTREPNENPTFDMELSPPVDSNRYPPPIQRIPPEILLEIVNHYIAPEPCLRDLVRLTLVCKRWSVIIQDAAFLWGTINADQGLAVVRQALRRAKDAPLDLTFNEKTAPMMRKDFFTSIGERTECWKSLSVDLTIRNWDFVLEDLEKGTAPSLEALRISAPDGVQQSRGMVTLFGGRPGPPQLKEITLVHVPINLVSLQLSGLRSLTLVGTATVSSTDILNIIIGSPAIEFIRLGCLESLTGVAQSQQILSRPDGVRNPPTQLTSLIHLSLDDIPIPFLHLVFSVIAAPQLRTLEVDCELVELAAAQVFLEALHHQIPNLARLTANVQMFEVYLSSYTQSRLVIGGVDIPWFMDEPPFTHSDGVLDQFCNRFGWHLEDLPLHLYTENLDPEEASRMEWFGRHLTVTKLTLYSDPYQGTALELVIPLFSRPTVSTPATWLLPQVEIFETNLVWGGGNTDIVEMIRNRHSAEGEKDGPAAPKPFREIWLSFGGKDPSIPPPVSTKFLREVQVVANGADVYWEKEKLP
ncbi:hypothetical protein M407DRAFT_24056 [Tulasnella calospora MUT 4182]|uniref:F-box domain-containing protein n=1 Tax=Tulasnella calospora MUT 4182 TaxID=1051891 RepID=A0A0C3QJZ6_9AGAM|nr:hypothetical protein M407DRAFT_24056 [Tulasnella calospora MUT 4182]